MSREELVTARAKVQCQREFLRTRTVGFPAAGWQECLDAVSLPAPSLPAPRGTGRVAAGCLAVAGRTNVAFRDSRAFSLKHESEGRLVKCDSILPALAGRFGWASPTAWICANG
jgi:hypothetical protein